MAAMSNGAVATVTNRPRQSIVWQPVCCWLVSLLISANVWATVPDAGTSSGARPDLAATQFARTCANCHTIGGGALRAPDLAGVAPWSEDQINVAIQTMQRKVGPLDAKLIAELTALLKDPSARSRVEAARTQLAHRLKQVVEPANSLQGAALVFGRTPQENGDAALMKQAKLQRDVAPPSYAKPIGLGGGVAILLAGVVYVFTRRRGSNRSAASSPRATTK